MEIDCVILWVDGNDPKWLKEKNKYIKNDQRVKTDQEEKRFRDWGVLKYLFRGIEKNAPFFRKIFFVTCGQKPLWLNEKHPQLIMVNHDEFIPNQYLPTFNSHTIELNLHRIHGLSNHFVYFNDDMFLLDSLRPSNFFVNGMPCDSAVLNAFTAMKTEETYVFLSAVKDTSVINRHFKKKEVIRKNFFKYFNIKYGTDLLRTFSLLPWKHITGFVNYHLPYSLKKQYFFELWEKEYELLNDTCMHKFRTADDVNIWLLLYWQYAEGDFYPRAPKLGHVCSLENDGKKNQEIFRLIKRKKRKIVVINDEVKRGNYREIQHKLNQAFDYIYPEKSSYEK
ncbi:Stealth CR1 domain-containing protein [Candidatus Ventrimonas sp. KK005]